jgi:2-isopropylmalate synthase
VTIRLKHEERIFSGRSANTDIIVASAQAYVNALNRLYQAIQTGGIDRTQAQREAGKEAASV